MKSQLSLILLLLPSLCLSFTNTILSPHDHLNLISNQKQQKQVNQLNKDYTNKAVSPILLSTTTSLKATPDLEIVSLVNQQYNYALAVVCMGEGIWSFIQAPSLSHAKILIAPIVTSVILVLVSGPLLSSSTTDDVFLALSINTGLSVLLGASYILRMIAPYSPSPKEAAFLGLLVSVAGFFSFSQNLVVNEFVTLPSLPVIPLPSFQLPTFDF